MKTQSNRGGPDFRQAAAVGVAGLFCLTLSVVSADAAKRKSGPVKQPDLRIVTLNVTPAAYSPQDGHLSFAVDVELPKELDGMLLLEVSSLISSPSKRSMRFLSSRQAIDHQGETVSTADGNARETKRRMHVKLIWDGMDQSKQAVPEGLYTYEVRAKLLTVGDSGPRTQMVSWPKRGTFVVK
jgi:hypothetical protein